MSSEQKLQAFDAQRLIDELARHRCPECQIEDGIEGKETPCDDCLKQAQQDLDAYAAGQAASQPAQPLQPQVEELSVRLQKRETELEGWLYQHAPEVFKDQHHLTVEGVRELPSLERKYWHYGYMVAVRDVRKWLAPTEEAK